MLYEKLKRDFDEYYSKSEEERALIPHLNCCERIILGANDVYNLELDRAAAMMAKGFGSGLNVGATCGVISGGVMALSVKFHNHPEYKAIVKEYIDDFVAEMGAMNCEPLKDKHATELKGCSVLITDGGRVLDRIFKKYSAE